MRDANHSTMPPHLDSATASCCDCPLMLPYAERILVVLRDGRKIIGVMRSFDQFANLVLEHAFERLIVGKRFADVPLGVQSLLSLLHNTGIDSTDGNHVRCRRLVRDPRREYRVAGPNRMAPRPLSEHSRVATISNAALVLKP